MNQLDLSLRQKKILHIMQHESGCITSLALGKQLHVSSRTIRNDVAKINEEIIPYGAEIKPLKSKGYYFVAKDKKLIENLNQINTFFFAKENRDRYLAIQLCLRDEPIDIYNLEDEMFISHTTLAHTIKTVTNRFSSNFPFIQLKKSKDKISFENNEVKKRQVLVKLLTENWNYHSRRNTFYDDSFIDSDNLDFIINIASKTLNSHDVHLEDAALVYFNLMLTIMLYRIKTGHELSSYSETEIIDPRIRMACREIFDKIESEYQIKLSDYEFKHVCSYVAEQKLIRVSKDRSQKDLYPYITSQMIDTADRFLSEINKYFHVDFSPDIDCYMVLLQFIHGVYQTVPVYNEQVISDMAKNTIYIEMVISNLFQKVIKKDLKNPLSEIQLIYLSHILAGGFVHYFFTHPSHRLKAIICCQMNIPIPWFMKRTIESRFVNQIEILDIIPVDAKNTYDFSNVDIIFSTVSKQITDDTQVDTISVPYDLTGDSLKNITDYLARRRFRTLTSCHKTPIEKLIKNALWHEASDAKTEQALLSTMFEDLLSRKIIDKEYIDDVIETDRISSFSTKPGIVFVYSLTPAKESIFSIASLTHRIMWNSYKIRIVIMAALTMEDMPVILRLSNILHDGVYDFSSLKFETDKNVITGTLLESLKDH